MDDGQTQTYQVANVLSNNHTHYHASENLNRMRYLSGDIYPEGETIGVERAPRGGGPRQYRRAGEEGEGPRQCRRAEVKLAIEVEGPLQFPQNGSQIG
jgi:hypothetical protein